MERKPFAVHIPRYPENQAYTGKHFSPAETVPPFLLLAINALELHNGTPIDPQNERVLRSIDLIYAATDRSLNSSRRSEIGRIVKGFCGDAENMQTFLDISSACLAYYSESDLPEDRQKMELLSAVTTMLEQKGSTGEYVSLYLIFRDHGAFDEIMMEMTKRAIVREMKSVFKKDERNILFIEAADMPQGISPRVNDLIASDLSFTQAYIATVYELVNKDKISDTELAHRVRMFLDEAISGDNDIIKHHIAELDAIDQLLAEGYSIQVELETPPNPSVNPFTKMGYVKTREDLQSFFKILHSESHKRDTALVRTIHTISNQANKKKEITNMLVYMGSRHSSLTKLVRPSLQASMQVKITDFPTKSYLDQLDRKLHAGEDISEELWEEALLDITEDRRY